MQYHCKHVEVTAYPATDNLCIDYEGGPKLNCLKGDMILVLPEGFAVCDQRTFAALFQPVRPPEFTFNFSDTAMAPVLKIADAVLSPAEPDPPPEPPTPAAPPLRAKELTLPEVCPGSRLEAVRACLRRGPADLDVVVKFVWNFFPNVSRADVSSALSNLKARGEVTRVGERFALIEEARSPGPRREPKVAPVEAPASEPEDATPSSAPFQLDEAIPQILRRGPKTLGQLQRIIKIRHDVDVDGKDVNKALGRLLHAGQVLHNGEWWRLKSTSAVAEN